MEQVSSNKTNQIFYYSGCECFFSTRSGHPWENFFMYLLTDAPFEVSWGLAWQNIVM